MIKWNCTAMSLRWKCHLANDSDEKWGKGLEQMSTTSIFVSSFVITWKHALDAKDMMYSVIKCFYDNVTRWVRINHCHFDVHTYDLICMCVFCICSVCSTLMYYVCQCVFVCILECFFDVHVCLWWVCEWECVFMNCIWMYLSSKLFNFCIFHLEDCDQSP